MPLFFPFPFSPVPFNFNHCFFSFLLFYFIHYKFDFFFFPLSSVCIPLPSLAFYLIIFLFISASKTCLCNQEFDDHHFTSMERNHRAVCNYLHIQEEAHHSQNATGCINSMEFNIQHAYVCMYLRDAFNKITEDHSLKLHDYELKDCEWKIVEELCNCLKVC